MKYLKLKQELVLWIFLAVPFVYIMYIWNSLPARVPTHFDISGNPNGWGGKYSVFVTPGISILVYALLALVPLIDPKKMSYESFQNAFFKIRLVIAAFLGIGSCFALNAAVTQGIRYNNVIPYFGFILIALLGNFMINIKPNWFIGIRTPWTLSSEYVWKQTHLVAGRVWFYGGIICFLLSLVIKREVLPILTMSFLIGGGLLFALYSFILYKREEKTKALNNDIIHNE
ncbi:MAG TPA: SdpI family protein [Chitinophagales bacterium]|nr:SdpI family protein [Chitinophagales bacterium]